MNLHLDANAVVEWERGRFDLPTWIAQNHPNDELRFSAAAWQELMYGAYAWEPARAQKRLRFLSLLGVSVRTYAERQADRAARIAAELKGSPIGFSDCQVAATALEDRSPSLRAGRTMRKCATDPIFAARQNPDAWRLASGFSPTLGPIS